MIEPGTRLGPYELQAALGTGGMGEVYRARDTRLDRTVAIKLLAPQVAAAPHLRARLEDEARAISQLNHPHICTLFDIGEAPSPGGAPGESVSFLVMELVQGETLAQCLDRGPLPLDQAVVYAAQIADALDKAHRLGIVHGDLKPANVMVTKAGVKLLDFGLATQPARRLEQGWADAQTRTVPLASPELVFGTLQYLAPEQLEGRSGDARSDIFSFGALLYEMITGRKAFDGPTPASIIAAILREAPRPIQDVTPAAPPALTHLVASCLAKDPDERWQHAGDLARELRWLGVGGGGQAPAPPAASRGVSRAWLAAAAALAVALAVALAALALRRPSPDAPTYRTSVLLPEGLRFPVAQIVGGVGRFAISPDGRRLAFVASDPAGNQRLWIRQLEALTAQSVAGTDGATSPFWAPDSRSVAFVAQGQLKTVDAVEGGAPVVIASPAFGTTGAWNRDNQIVFTPTASSALAQVAASGGDVRPVTTLDAKAGDVMHRNPVFLPDGRRFLFVAVSARPGGTTGARAVYVGSLGGDAPRLLIDRGSNALYSQGHLLFLRENALLAQPFDPDDLTLSGEARPVAEQVELTTPTSASFSVSESGVLAYQTASGQGSQLVWFDRQGRRLGSVGEPAEYGDLELSPDGRQAMVSVIDPVVNTRDLWMLDVSRGVRTRFTFDPADDVSPVWAPDGSHVFFASNRTGHFDIYQKSSSGVGSEELVQADDAEKYPTSVSSDGRTLIYWMYKADGANLAMLPLAGESGAQPLMGMPVSPGRLSPDGRWLAYYSAESGRSEVYVVPYPEPSARWQVSAAGGSLARWRADGREIFYAGRDNRLMAVPVTPRGSRLDVGAAQALFDARPVGPRSFYDVAADGQQFLVNTDSEGLSPSITIVQNWKSALAP